MVEDEELYKSLQAMPFYHGFLPRDDLGVIIRNEGDYLIRVSEITTVSFMLAVSSSRHQRFRSFLL